MKVVIPKGKYVVAVSGGVDSVVLLDLLVSNKEADLIVAHIDHGIREDSCKDRLFVERLAAQKGLLFECIEAKLGEEASEEMARNARYYFLNSILEKYNADRVVTAHHQDDVIETAILNMLRGTGRKGITSLRSTEKILRPLVEVSKKDILQYAKDHNLTWHEDSTNTNTKYLRNYVRIKILSKLSERQRSELLQSIADMHKINIELDEIMDEYLCEGELDKSWYIGLPHEVASEALASWLRKNGIRDFDRKLIEKLVVGIKVAKNGKKLDVKNGAVIKVAKNTLILVK